MAVSNVTLRFNKNGHFQKHHPLQESKVVCLKSKLNQFSQTPGQFTKLNKSIQLLNWLNHPAGEVKESPPPPKDNMS